jgi:dTDP-4-dehydrorhamnose 3,5-epimerase-like enzyme|tara:strand:- start:10 stop:429 length:420 start_codon:yes stop_codon:yes gene_type:complete
MSKTNIQDIQYHEDDRGQRLLNIFPEVNGQINITHVNSTSHIVAWHRHEIQTDYWYCPKGSFKVGLGIPKEDGSVYVEWQYLSDKDQKILKIEPGIWHGYMALQPESIMLYYLTEKYDPQDEWKLPPGSFDEEWGIENK